jgi:hypothetical protein
MLISDLLVSGTQLRVRVLSAPSSPAENSRLEDAAARVGQLVAGTGCGGAGVVGGF